MVIKVTLLINVKACISNSILELYGVETPMDIGCRPLWENWCFRSVMPAGRIKAPFGPRILGVAWLQAACDQQRNPSLNLETCSSEATKASRLQLSCSRLHIARRKPKMDHMLTIILKQQADASQENGSGTIYKKDVFFPYRRRWLIVSKHRDEISGHRAKLRRERFFWSWFVVT